MEIDRVKGTGKDKGKGKLNDRGKGKGQGKGRGNDKGEGQGKGKGSQKGKSKSNAQSNVGPAQCLYCHKAGHWKRDCFKYKKILLQARFKPLRMTQPARFPQLPLRRAFQTLDPQRPAARHRSPRLRCACC